MITIAIIATPPSQHSTSVGKRGHPCSANHSGTVSWVSVGQIVPMLTGKPDSKKATRYQPGCLLISVQNLLGFAWTEIGLCLNSCVGSRAKVSGLTLA